MPLKAPILFSEIELNLILLLAGMVELPSYNSSLTSIYNGNVFELNS